MDARQESIEFKVRDFLEANFASAPFSSTEDLFEAGILDSLSFLRMLAFLEQTFAVSFDSAQIRFENFRNLDAITAHIMQKHGNA